MTVEINLCSLSEEIDKVHIYSKVIVTHIPLKKAIIFARKIAYTLL